MSHGHDGEMSPPGRDEPPRLQTGDGAAARALAALDESTAIASPIEERAWRHLRARLSQQPSFRQAQRHRPAIAWALLAGAGFAAVLLLALAPRLRRSSTPQSSSPAPTVAVPSALDRGTTIASSDSVSAPPAAPAPLSLPVAAPLALSTRPRRLPVGASIIDGAITASTAKGSHAIIWRDQHGKDRIALSTGKVQIDVQGPHHVRPVAVEAGNYRFVDVGTVFEVTRDGRSVRLWVQAGAVEVWCRQTVLATIEAGARWSAALSDGDACRSHAPPPIPPTSGPPAAGLSRCESLVADGDDRAAADCLSPLADGAGLTAETALYEMARLQSRRFDDVAGALSTLQTQRRRFPNGALRDEADLTAIELLPRAGRHQEALDLSASFLRRHPRESRAAELHLLRGNILCESFADYPAAAREYAAAQSAAGASGDDAAFFGAVCRELSGARHEAIGAYRAYLARSSRRHEAEARARLATLGGD